MKLVIGSDHAAFQAKEELKRFLQEQKYTVEDVGTSSEASCHYPTYATEVVKMVKKESIRGIILCGSGIGVSMVANRFKGIRAALCRSEEDARLSRQHNDANVLCLGGRSTSMEDLLLITQVWLKTEFESGRHQERIKLFDQLGEEI